VLQVEEQELAICSGRRSINKNTTFKEIRKCIAIKEIRDKKRFYIGGAATRKEKRKRRRKSP